MGLQGRICTFGIWDESIPGINFDKNGVSNYARIYQTLCKIYPRGSKGEQDWLEIVNEIKTKEKNKKYDCIVGVSGGTDSSYLMHLLKKVYGLRPLAVTFDNGWSSDIAVRNIKKITEKLNIDLETYVVNYEEMKEIHKAYMRASFPWIDMPTDFAIRNILLKTAVKEKVKYIFSGHDFRSEGTQPNEWTHGDSRQFKFIIKNYGNVKLESFPYLNYFQQIYLMYIRGIKIIKPYYYLDYQKKNAQKFLIENYDWEYYGGHHFENIFTRFAIAYWLKKKFNIDKRIITFSAQILNKELDRAKAIEMIKSEPYDKSQMEADKNYVIKKLGLTTEEFEKMWNNENKSVYDFPSYLGLINKFSKIIKPILMKVYKQPPTFLYQMDERNKD